MLATTKRENETAALFLASLADHRVTVTTVDLFQWSELNCGGVVEVVLNC